MSNGTLRDAVSINDKNFISKMFEAHPVTGNEDLSYALSFLKEKQAKLKKERSTCTHWLAEIGLRAGQMIKVGRNDFNCATFDAKKEYDGKVVEYAKDEDLTKNNVWVGELFTMDDMDAISRDLNCGDFEGTAFHLRNTIQGQLEDVEKKIRRINVILNKYGPKEEK